MKKVLGIFIFLSFMVNLYAGYVMTESENGEEKVTYIQDNMMKIVEKEAIIIFDLNKKTMLNLIPQMKVYTGGNISEFKKMMKDNLNAAVQGMEQSLEQNPDNAMIKAYIDSIKKQLADIDKPVKMKDFKIEMKKTGEKEKIAGKNTEKYDVYVDGEKNRTVWISKDIDISKELDLNKILDFQKEMVLSFNFGDESDDDSMIDYRVTEKIYKLGYPLREQDHKGLEDEIKMMEENAKLGGYELTEEMKKDYIEQMGMEAEYSINITKVESKDIPKSEFEVPNDYKKMDPTELMQQSMMQGE